MGQRVIAPLCRFASRQNRERTQRLIEGRTRPPRLCSHSIVANDATILSGAIDGELLASMSRPCGRSPTTSVVALGCSFHRVHGSKAGFECCQRRGEVPVASSPRRRRRGSEVARSSSGRRFAPNSSSVLTPHDEHSAADGGCATLATLLRTCGGGRASAPIRASARACVRGPRSPRSSCLGVRSHLVAAGT